MGFTVIPGSRSYRVTRDKEGQREYKVTHRVTTTDSLDGPFCALNASGLPQPGDWWIVGNDSDLWAWCRADAEVVPVVENEPCTVFDVTQTFSTKPPDTQRCQSTPVQDPLLEPMKVTGDFSNYQEEAVTDRYGVPILTSSFEQFRGKEVEFDKHRASVHIEKNVASLNLGLVTSMLNTVNMYTLWGLPPRTIKFSRAPWERKVYGNCYVYFSYVFEFDIRFDTFDRTLLDEGNKCLKGHWDESTGFYVLDPIKVDAQGNKTYPNYLDPTHYGRFKDRKGENARVILNGYGLPAGVTVTEGTGTWMITSGTGSLEKTAVGYKKVEKYTESDFLLLGIPTDFSVII